MAKWVNRIFKSQIATALICVILGILLIAMPEKFMNAVATSVSLVVLAIGVIHLYLYLKNRQEGLVLDLVVGVLLSVVGVFLLFNSRIFESMLPVLMGVIILVDSFWTFQASLELRRLHFVRWPWLFFVTSLFAVLAVVIIFNPFETMRIATIFGGIVFLFNGLADFFFLLLLKNKEKIMEKMNEVMIMETKAAHVNGEVIDAEVSSDGHIIEEGVEIIEEEAEEPIFSKRGMVVAEEDCEIIDTE